jgi:hypothetical protein
MLYQLIFGSGNRFSSIRVKNAYNGPFLPSGRQPFPCSDHLVLNEKAVPFSGV